MNKTDYSSMFFGRTVAILLVCLALITFKVSWGLLVTGGLLVTTLQTTLFGFSGVSILLLGIAFKVFLLGAKCFEAQIRNMCGMESN